MFPETWNVLLAVVVLVSLLFLYGRWENGHFSRKGMKSLPTYFPFLGHTTGMLCRREHLKDTTHKSYSSFPDDKYFGFRLFTTPLVLVKDIQLMKQIAIKDFDHFTDHVGLFDESVEPLFGKALMSLRGEKWREMRAALSPVFTAAKMRGMFDFVAEIAEQVTDFYIEQMEKPENKEKGLVEVEVKDVFTRYGNDVIASAAFGLKVNSLTNRNNEFYMSGKEATNFSGLAFCKFLGLSLAPKLMKFMKISLFSASLRKFFSTLVIDTMKRREKNNIVRHDMIQLLMEAKKGTLKHEEAAGEDAMAEESTAGKKIVETKWTDDDLIAQAVFFLIAGFDSTSSLICFMAHAVTVHPDVQEKLREEVDEVDEVAASGGGTVSYNELQNMKYMDMVVSETLRLWPSLVATNRKCVKPYTLPPSNVNSKPVLLNINDAIWLPIYSIHHDPKYFEDPETFDPERFSDKNKGNIIPFTFIPFGIGPRYCISSQFALMEVKTVMFHLLRKFELVQIARTQNPIQIRKDTFMMHAENGFWIGLKPRITDKV